MDRNTVPASPETINLHATCVVVSGVGLLLRGPAGSGKSDLALRLIDAGGVLVADDRVDLARRGEELIARAPAVLAGRLEVRGLGIMALACAAEAVVELVVDLVPPNRIERYPEPDRTVLLGCDLPRLDLAPFEASAVAKLRLAVASLVRCQRPGAD